MMTKKRKRSQRNLTKHKYLMSHKSSKSAKTGAIKRPFREHLGELRSRFFWSITVLFLGAFIGYFFHEQLLTFLLKPLHQTVYYSSPTGGLDFIFKICLFFGFFVSLPVFTYNILRFIQPVFPKHITGLLIKVIFSSYILMLCGMSFAYCINIPVTLHFFNEFSSGQLHALISTNEYLSFILTDLIGFGLIFQMPLMLLFINSLQPISIKWLFKQEKYVIVISFLLGAILAPDPVNQTIMALPIILLYQVSIGILFVQNRKRKSFK
jgi:sec-independent protein translocase protein TatC